MEVVTRCLRKTVVPKQSEVTTMTNSYLPWIPKSDARHLGAL